MLRIWFMVGMCILLMAFPGVSSTHGVDVSTQNMQETLQNLPYVHGQRVSEATFDQKVVIVTFFASWCPPCREEFGHLGKLHAEYHASGVEVIAVNLFEDFDNLSDDKRLTTFLSLTNPPFSVVKGNDLVSRQFGMITRIPTLFIFDRHGQHVLRFANEAGGQQMTLDLSTLRQTISRLL